MAFAHEPFYNQSSVWRINVMVVDDDPVFLQIMSQMLEKSNSKDPSLVDITVVAARDPMEALSTLKTHQNNIDLIVTDYYMPGMNGIQLKQQITHEFGNLPVIVMSMDANKEKESLTCGAMCFIPKPIKSNDLTKIYQYAITYKRNGKSIILTEQNHKDTDVTVPQQIEALPDQTNVMVETKKKKKYSSAELDSRSVNTNGSGVIAGGSLKDRKRKSNGGSGDDSDDVPRPSKKPHITWTDDLRDLFLQAIRHIGYDKAVPKKILKFMNIPNLTTKNVASHLQKYRIFLKKVSDQGMLHSNLLPTRSMGELHYNSYTPSTSWYETGLNNRSFYTKPGHGLGQSRLLSNTREPVRFNQTSPNSYINRSSTYVPPCIGSNLTLPKSYLNTSNQPSQNEGQISQVVGFGQHGPSNVNGNSLNNDFGSFTLTEPGLSSFGSSSLMQPGQSSLARLPPNQPNVVSSLISNPSGMSTYGSSSPNQPGQSSSGSLTPNQPRVVSNFESLITNQSGVTNYGSSTPNQPVAASFGSLTPNQSGLSSFGSLNPNEAGSSHFSFGIESFLNNENEAYKPSQPHANANTQPNLEIPQLENFNIFDDLGNMIELAFEKNNLQLDHNKPQGEDDFTKFDLPDLPPQLNQTRPVEEDISGGWTSVNINQDHFNGEISNNFAVPETDLQNFNMKPTNQGHFSGETLNNFAAPETDFPNFKMNPTNQGHFNGEISNNFGVPETDFPNFTMNPTNQVHFSGETSNSFAAPETEFPNFNMNPTNQGHFNGEISNNLGVRKTDFPNFNINATNQVHFSGEISNNFAAPETDFLNFNIKPY